MLRHTMRTAFKKAAYNIAKTVVRPVGLYPFPKTHRRHFVEVLNSCQIDCVLDVGAHYGEFGQLLRELRFAGHILSFEPVSDSFRRLQAASNGDPKWKIFPFALGSADETSQIHLYRSSDFNSLLSPAADVHDRFEECTQELATESIAVRRLDSALEECLKGIDSPRILLKMDTQGYDLEIFRGATGVLDRILAIQSELPGICHYAGQPSMLETLGQYWGAGYRPTGFFPVNHEADGVTVMEWDCILVREGTLAH